MDASNYVRWSSIDKEIVAYSVLCTRYGPVVY